MFMIPAARSSKLRRTCSHATASRPSAAEFGPASMNTIEYSRDLRARVHVVVGDCRAWLTLPDAAEVGFVGVGDVRELAPHQDDENA